MTTRQAGGRSVLRPPAQAARIIVATLGWIALFASAVHGQSVTPFVGPPFARYCDVHHFAEGEAPALDGFPEDPLCVEYEKRDITVTNAGAVDFLAAEPARFAIAIPKCRYWQQDHWRIQVQPTDPSIVGWDGSYWFDKGAGDGGARLRNFTIGGQPATPEQVAVLVEPLDPDMAAVIRQYGDASGGGGATICLGGGDPTCQVPPHCTDGPCGHCAVATTRDAIDGECSCSNASTHGAYVSCVRDAADRHVAAGDIGPECRGAVVRCASNSTCGRPDAVTCCRTNAGGVTKCHVKSSALRCRAPQNGSVCAGAAQSCCDACTDGGCAQSPPPCS